MDRSQLKALLTHPLTRRVYWVIYAVLFYQAGLAFTTWLLQPESFAGGGDWFWLALFPLLLPGFFIVNRYLGCATGTCTSGSRCRIETGDPEQEERYRGRMPGM